MTSAALEPVLTWLLANGVKPDRAHFAVSQLASLWNSRLKKWSTLIEIGIAGSHSKARKSVPHIWLYPLWSEIFSPKSQLGLYLTLQKRLAEQVSNPLLPDVVVRFNVFSAQSMSPETFEASLRQICDHSKKQCLAFLKKNSAAPSS